MAENNDSFELLEQIERLKDAAYRDSLTGLLNRGVAEIYVENALARMREGDSCMLIIVDLDNFKMVNDTLGHQTGDRVIRTAANILSDLFRPGDIVSRLGGDEYIVFLCGKITKKLAKEKGEQICENLQLTVGDQKKVSISSSVGIYLSSGTCTSFQELYRMADTALYRAKNSGKNQYIISEDDDVHERECGCEERHGAVIQKEFREENYFENNTVLINNAADAQVIYADASLCRILGIQERGMEGRSFLEYVHPDDASAFGMLIESEDSEISVQVRLKSPSDDWIYYKVYAVSIEYGNSRCILLNLVNVLEINRTDASQKTAKELSVVTQEQNTWVVDWNTKRFHFLNSDGRLMSVRDDACIFPYDLIGTGWVAPESVNRFMKFATGLFHGRLRGYGNFLIRSGNGSDYVWATLSYRTRGDAYGVPRQIVGTAEPLSSDMQAQKILYAGRNMIPVSAVDGMIVKLDANVTKDEVIRTWMEGSIQEQEYDHKKLSYFVVNEARKIYDLSDKAKFTEFFSRDHLESMYQRGIYWTFAEYRRIDSNGYIEWVTLAMNLYRKTFEEDVLLRLRINNCDDRHVWECYSLKGSIRDKLNNLYSQETAREILHGLRTEAVNELCAAAFVRIEGLGQICGHDQNKRRSTEKYIVNMLSYTLGMRCIASKVEEERYLFLFPDIFSSVYVNRALEMAFNYSKMLLFDVMPVHSLHFVAAVICSQIKSADYDSMLTSVRELAESVKEIEEDKIVFCEESMPDESEIRASQADFANRISVINPAEQTVGEAEQTVFSDGLSDLLLSSSIEAGLHALFQRVGDYYRADRVYMLSVENRNRDIEVSCEWKLPNLEAVSVSLAHTSINKYQLLTRCSIEKKPIRYHVRRHGQAGDQESEREEWSCCIFPVCFSEHAFTVTDFLCVENPRNNDSGYGLINKFIPYIKNQKFKLSLHADHSMVIGRNRLDSLPNLMKYIYIIPQIVSQTYTSMSIFLVKVPRLSVLNSHHGFEYGRSLLYYITDTMIEVFGNQYLFRTWDNEFIALLPNVSRKNAEERDKNLKVKFERRYDEHIFVNYRWTEGNFTSRELMNMPKAGVRGNVADVEAYLNSQVSETAVDSLEECSFTIYIQPVFDVKSGTVAGAELLLRGVDKNGNVLLPHSFLKRMIHDGMIKNMDLFVLEQALIIIENWHEQGIAEIPLTINFAKETILDNTIFASILAVRSRYPRLNHCKIGIEIPQNVGEENYERLESIMEQLQEFDTGFAIDDLGVDQENAKILNRLRFDMVKIDHSLMIDVESSATTRNTIRMIVDHCKENHSFCVAEGVETKEQLEIVRQLGCGYVQGFYFEKPLTIEEFNQKYMAGTKL